MKWKGYPNEENTWEPEKNITNAKDVMADFHRTHSNAPRRLRNIKLSFQPTFQYTEPQYSDVEDATWEEGK